MHPSRDGVRCSLGTTSPTIRSLRSFRISEACLSRSDARRAGFRGSSAGHATFGAGLPILWRTEARIMIDHGLDLAVVGNCRTAALVNPVSRLVWWCFPNFDAN